jgi:putative transposase
MSRGNARQEIFLDADDYSCFLRRLAATTQRFRVRCHAYCLMVNHFHLLLEPSELPLSRMMQQLNSSYTQWFNRRHGRVGHVLQGRPRMLLIDRDDYFRRVLRYIARNPVRANLVSNPADWRWSSYRATAGIEKPPSFLTLDRVWSAFDPRDVRHAQRLYRALVDGAADAGEDDEPRGRVFFGGRELVTRLQPRLAPHRTNDDFLYADRFAGRLPLDHLFRIAPDPVSLDRFMQDAFDRHGYTLREIGAFVGQRPNTVWKRIRRARLTSAVDAEEKIQI